MMAAFAWHVLESTVFALLAGLLTLAFRNNHARVRHGLWMAASLKFLVPFSMLLALGSGAGRLVPRAMHPRLPAVVEEVSLNFVAPAPAAASMTARPAGSDRVPALLLCIWAAGFAGVALRWCFDWRHIRAVVRRGRSVSMPGLPIPAVATAALLEPGVFGLFRPVLLLPEGITERLSRAELQSVIAHELCHVRHGDNLLAALHMFVEAIFWFHPLVWWMGRRLVDERERACDEEVVGTGCEPRSYAESILKVCRLYVESPLACAAGVTGADLKRRIEEIMKHKGIERLDAAKMVLLGAAAMAAIAGPVVVGMLTSQVGRAQSPAGMPAKPAFEVASIKPSNPSNPGQPGERRFAIRIAPGGRFTATGVSVKMLIEVAYDVRDFQITGGPNWLDSEHYDINAKGEGDAGMNRDQLRLMLQGLLADRFHLELHKGTKELPGYALVVAKGGPKLQAAEPGPGKGPMMRMGMGELSAQGVPASFLAMHLARVLGRPVTDKTGLAGAYDFKLQWTPEVAQAGPKEPDGAPPAAASEAGGPSLFTALQEQLGLKLESHKGPAEILIIDRVEKATEN